MYIYMIILILFYYFMRYYVNIYKYYLQDDIGTTFSMIYIKKNSVRNLILSMNIINTIDYKLLI